MYSDLFLDNQPIPFCLRELRSKSIGRSMYRIKDYSPNGDHATCESVVYL